MFLRDVKRLYETEEVQLYFSCHEGRKSVTDYLKQIFQFDV